MTTYKLAKWFSKAGHDVGVFSFESSGHIEQNFAKLFSAPKNGGATCRENLSALQVTMEKFQPEIVINQMPYEHAIDEVLRNMDPPLLLGCLRNTLYSVRNNLDQYGAQVLPAGMALLFRNAVGRAILLRKHRGRHREDLKRILATHDNFVMFGPPNLDELRYFVPDFDESKVSLIPNSIPTVLDELPKKKKRLLWLGRLSYGQKRADLILPVWKRVHAALPDWELDVVGDGSATESLRRKVEDEGIVGVTFHGQQSPDMFFSQATIYMMTSSFEGFPNTLVEAQSFAAVPVMFDTFPIARWIVTSGQDGYLIRPFDVEAMADRIVAIAQGDKQTELMIAALENARRFQIDSVGQRWIGLFEECLDGKNDAPHVAAFENR